MKILIVDNTMESQAFCAKRIDAFSQNDIEMLDLVVETTTLNEYMEFIDDVDVIILGSGLEQDGIMAARQTLAAIPWIHIVMFVTDEAYGGGAFRAAHSAGVRKVFPDSASPLDLLQELVAIHSEFKREGRTKEGKLIVTVQAKGGVGSTSIIASLAEVCSHFNKRTMLWDLDVETKDLCRALTVSGQESQIVSSWINGEYELSKQSLQEALIPISTDVSVLMPPDQFAESLDLVCHTDGMAIATRIAELSKPLFDVILVDTAGSIGPAVGGLLQMADIILVIIDDTVLGLTAVEFYLNNLKNLIGNTDRIKFLINPYTGAPVSVSEIAEQLEPSHNLGTDSWTLPIMPNDPKGAMWAGSGYTLYSMGLKNTAQILEEIAAGLGLITLPPGHFGEYDDGGAGNRNDGWFAKVFGKKKTIDNESYEEHLSGSDDGFERNSG